eukprot:5775681-Ditylum_brightwellii.AAC.1
MGASFAGKWSSACSEESISVLSITGYIIKYENCPIVWTSKLKTEITLSITEAEYVVLSQAMREVIPLMQLLNGTKGAIKITTEHHPEFKYPVFEDNEGSMKVAKCPIMRPRTKYIAIDYWLFRDTDDQKSDLLTKNLDRVKF